MVGMMNQNLMDFKLMKDFIIKLQHDNGVVGIEVKSEDIISAIRMVCLVEKAPIGAVIYAKQKKRSNTIKS